ncbi:MAG TPA: hypothetical protein VLT83_14095 [Opitutaceae bacterium]|nr:hypothetical protein [Opitutaceae bacterium]
MNTLEPSRLGHWADDDFSLPKFRYTGALPAIATDRDGRPVKLPPDPWFLLGNYRITLFAHVSGALQLITGERAWGRLNQGAQPNSGANRASLTFEGAAPRSVELVGLGSVAADAARSRREFGCGWAEYGYDLGETVVTRRLEVAPSLTPHDGVATVLVRVTVRNRTDRPLAIAYHEAITVRYESIQQQRKAAGERAMRYRHVSAIDTARAIAKADNVGEIDDPLDCPTPDTISRHDGFPPTLFLQALVTPDGAVPAVETGVDGDELALTSRAPLAPGAAVTIEFAIGFTWRREFAEIAAATATWRKSAEPAAGFGRLWRKMIPDFSGESDAELRRELQWHAYTLEAMATYSAFYGETKIPQGTVYDYDWGVQASARDHFQHALPLCHTNPALARSVLRYMIKRITPWGRIRLIEFGYGYNQEYVYFASDQQLFFFLLVAEYLRVTGDLGFLREPVKFSPGNGTENVTVLDAIEQCFRFLRDEVGVGKHGLVRLLNSDWNDAVYYIVKEPYNRVLYTGESHLNSAMACVTLDELAALLKSAAGGPEFAGEGPRLERLTASIRRFRGKVLHAFLADLDGRDFPRRLYFAGRAYGDDNMFLEPQGYTLLIPELSAGRKRALYREVRARLLPGEKIGARQQQTPEFEDSEFDPGSRENGGVWWALNGPLILGVATFDRAEAWRLLRGLTLANCAGVFPRYWSSYWSSADNIESSLIPAEGLPDQSSEFADSPVFCAHQHAWILHCYFRLTG